MLLSRLNFNFFMILLLCLLALSYLSGCGSAYSDPHAPQIKMVKILEVPANYQQQNFNFVAQISASQRAQLAFQVPGKIETFQVKMGQKVNKGQLLAQLDPSDYRLLVKAKQAQFDLQKLKLERGLSLYKKQLLSEDNYDRLKTAFTVAQTDLEQVKTDLSKSQLRAPFSGVVAFTFAKAHQFVGAKQTILHLQGRDSLDVTFNLPIHTTDKINLQEQLPQELWVSLDSFPNLKLPAQFKEMATQADEDTNSYSVTLITDRPKGLNILPGMSGQVHLQYAQQAVSHFLLPKGALLKKNSGLAKVWLIDAQTQRLNAVDVELDEQGFVVSGLEAGDRIVAAGAKQLSRGQQVRAWKREGGI